MTIFLYTGGTSAISIPEGNWDNSIALPNSELRISHQISTFISIIFAEISNCWDTFHFLPSEWFGNKFIFQVVVVKLSKYWDGFSNLLMDLHIEQY